MAVDLGEVSAPARNVEIKARVRDAAALRARAAAISDHGPQQLSQRDTFFHCPNGRLKLREFGDGSAELIFYQRADLAGPKVSSYTRVPVAGPAALLRETLAAAWGRSAEVVKERTVYLVGATRIHLDAVQGLGDFMELEVVLTPQQDAADGEAVAHALMAQLGVAAGDLVHGAYADLLAA